MTQGITELNQLIGIPYMVHGRDPKSGLDCYGLATLVLGMAGINLPDVFYTDTDTETNKRIMESLEATIPNTKIEHPEKNCIIEFTIIGQPSHIGVYLGEGEFIHSSRQYGVVIDKLYRWKHRIKGYYRVNH
jgi:cell wall-associated NlpC family hydrolase